MIQPAVSLRLQRRHQLRGDGAERDHHAGLAGGRGDDAHVLVVQRDPEAGLEVARQHRGPLALQHRAAGPPCTMVLPTAPKTGAAASKSAAAPPTMIDSTPSMAPCSPPDTGASSIRKPRSVASAAIAAATSGRMEEKSMISAPGAACSNTPPSPASTARTSGESG